MAVYFTKELFAGVSRPACVLSEISYIFWARLDGGSIRCQQGDTLP